MPDNYSRRITSKIKEHVSATVFWGYVRKKHLFMAVTVSAWEPKSSHISI